MPRGVFPKQKKKKTVSSFSHESDFGDCDGTKPRFRRVALQRLPSRYSADCLLVFSTLGAIDFQTVSSRFTLRPYRQWNRAAINLRVFHLSKQRPPLPNEFLKCENLCRGQSYLLMMRHEDNLEFLYTINLSRRIHLLALFAINRQLLSINYKFISLILYIFSDNIIYFPI